MVKTKITETTEKYDENGKLVEKITREETTDDDTVYYPQYTPPVPLPNIRPYDTGKRWEPYCTVTAKDTSNTNFVQTEEYLILREDIKQ